MITSMTGFGSASVATALGKFSVEIKTVNSRYLDCSFRLPSTLNFLELKLRDMIGREIQRGKVDYFLKWEPSAACQPRVQLNVAAIEEILREYRRACKKLGISQDLPMSAVLQLPAVTMVTAPEIDEKGIWAAAERATRRALRVVCAFRRREGRALLRELRRRLRTIERAKDELAARKDAVVERYRRRLVSRAKEFLKEHKYIIEDSRMQTEVLLYADKADVTEELVRLRSHIETFRKTLAKASSEPVGKSLEFLTQELLREANTVGSKAREVGMAHAVLVMKNEIEKIREQIQNVE
jgi:uncharacterized protein (TIGR00255 family)